MRSLTLTCTLASTLAIAITAPGFGQVSSSAPSPNLPLETARITPPAATSATVVPMLVRYDGVAARTSNTAPGSASMTFLIFKDETGGYPLWIETQTAALDPAGRYEVYLGSTHTSGLPPDLFGTGEARWVEVQIAGELTGPRTLLTSVPYALKAADAATLGGLPASAFVLASAASSTSTFAPLKANGITSDASSSVTTSGGINFYVPRFSSATNIINSQIYDNGTSVGIGGIPNASVKLDVNGAMIMRGNMQVTRTGNATASTGYPSYGFQFYSSAYNSSSKTTDNPYFQLQSEPSGNNTASPAATFNLLFSNNGSKPAETGLSINPDGTINFTTYQTFTGNSTTGNPGLYGTSSYGPGVSGFSESGDGVSGATSGYSNATAGVYGKSGSASGTTSTAAGIWGDSYSGVGVLGTSYNDPAVRGISTNGAGVAGTSTYSNGMLGYTAGSTLNTAGVTGQVGGTSGFSGIAGVWGDTNTHVGIFGTSAAAAGVLGESTNGVGVQGTSTNSYAGQFSNSNSSAAVYASNAASSGGISMYGVSSGAGGFALYGVSQGANGVGLYGTGNGSGGTGVIGYAAGNGVVGQTTGGADNTAGVLGVVGARTNTSGIAAVWGDAQEHVGVLGSSFDYAGVYGSSFKSYGLQGSSTESTGIFGVSQSASGTSTSNPFFKAGVWGDASTGVFAGVLGTADNNFAGAFVNNSSSAPTLVLENRGGGPQNGSYAGYSNVLQASGADGTCVIGGRGDLSCTGQMKTLTATASGAKTVETYSMQSTENWMEDFGSGKTQSGVATIALDAGFAEIVSGSADYHVFLTPRDDCNGLYVTNLTAGGFEVHELGRGTSSVGFDYRIVAKRKGFEAQRMVDVTEAMKQVDARKLKSFEQAVKRSPSAQ